MTDLAAPPVRLRLARRLEALDQLAGWVENYAAAHRLSPRAAFQLDLVLAEAVTNSIEHGGSAGGDIEITCATEDGQVQVEISDDGPAFDPTHRAAPPRPTSLAEATPGGLGVHLIRQYSQSMDYRREAGRNHLVLVLRADA